MKKLLNVLVLAGCVSAALGAQVFDYRGAMRSFIVRISVYAKAHKPGFLVLPQNGQELFTLTGEPNGRVAEGYLSWIDGTGREDLFYGENGMNSRTPTVDNQLWTGLCNIAKSRGKTILVTDYCSTAGHVDYSYSSNHKLGFVSFAANHLGLDNIPAYPAVPYRANSLNVDALAQAANLLYLINPNYATKDKYMAALKASQYDILLLDLFTDGTTPFSTADINALRVKPHGGRRLLLAYMSIGEAEDYRYYWQPAWKTTPPSWLGAGNPDWPGNYAVRYWDPKWQAYMFGGKSYVQKIIDAGFDGVYLDKVDEFEYWENGGK